MNIVECIPFINTEYDCNATRDFYPDSVAVRINLETIGKTRAIIPVGPKRWIDASIDGLHHSDLSKLTQAYQTHLNKFADSSTIADPTFQQNPIRAVVEKFVFSVLYLCKAETPDWVSVPQLPLVSGVGRNKINRLLAELTRQWKIRSAFPGKLILPIIFTHQNQLNKKTERNRKLASISACYTAASADGVWVVDSTLNDQEGAGTFDQRFPALRKFHDELKETLPDNRTTICGPYWGMNLVLWTRGSATHPAVGLGGAYKYYIPGQQLNKGNTKVVLKALRRTAIASPSLRSWIKDTVASLPADDPVRTEFAALEKEYSKLNGETAKRRIAEFHRSWFNRFTALPPSGRALALYQDLSSAYVVGKNLKPLPKDEKTARRPERVAQQLMLNCL
jgi:hypothetical protein